MINEQTEKKLSQDDEVYFIRREKAQVRKEFNSKFLNDLGTILVKCFVPTKKKKEHFISQEKIELDLLKLLQSQKKFKNSDLIQSDLAVLAAYDNVENIICRIVGIDLMNQKISLMSMTNYRHNKITERSFKEIELFDYTSIKLQYYFDKQKKFFDSISYKESFCFLNEKSENFINDLNEKSGNNLNEEKKVIMYSLGCGIKLTRRIDKEGDLSDC